VLRVVGREQSTSVAAGLWALGALGVLLALGCTLEEALGVDDGVATTGDATTGAGPDGGPGPSSDGIDGGSSTGPATTGDGSSDTGPGLPPSSCGGLPVRVATFNVESIGDEGTPSFEALASILVRIDADVVCLEEVQYWETPALFALADAAGYPDAIQAQESPAIGGDHTNACLARGGLYLVGSYSGRDLSDDPSANDVGRDILVVQVDLAQGQDPPCRLGVVALHLKSGQEQLDWFRRQIEVERTAQAVALYLEQYPGDPMVIVGDLNEQIDDPALGSVFTGVPMGLPDSYQVGSDIAFPLEYQPFTRIEGLGLSVAPATQEDSTRDQTWSDAVRLDYLFHGGAQLVAAEVYNACRDDGAGGLPKAGAPLPCGTSDEASDHFPVLADLVLP
jgi:endonuclease/exonuclease/phosphatase family metal-dependent hydrolase